MAKKNNVPGPFFVSFEGGEGSGKSTQAPLLHSRLWAQDIPATLIHEPGSTPLGDHLREFLVGKPRMTREAELLLFEAARAELVLREIIPSLDEGLSVVADRFEASSIAYQGWGRQIDISVVEYLNAFATNGRYPDLTILLDLDPEDGLRRVGDPQLSFGFLNDGLAEVGRLDKEGARRFEDQPMPFHRRIREGFLSLARGDPKRWIIIDATLPIQVISDEVWDHVCQHFGLSVHSK